MNDLPWHPKLVHLPLALAVLVPLLGSGVLLAWWRGWLERRAWWLIVAMQVLLLVSGMAAKQSGEGDEDIVEQAGIPHEVIHEHEEHADQFLAGVFVVMLAAIGAACVDEKLGLGLAGATLALSLVVLALGVRVGSSGGALVYQHGAAAAHMGR